MAAFSRSSTDTIPSSSVHFVDSLAVVTICIRIRISGLMDSALVYESFAFQEDKESCGPVSKIGETFRKVCFLSMFQLPPFVLPYPYTKEQKSIFQLII
jgi:hypothetical protein